MTFSTLWILLLLAGCVPAVPPPQLNATPGAFVRVDGERYDAGVFDVAYPPGWRIVKSSIAAAPMQVVFVAPDESMTITLSETPLPEPEAGVRSEEVRLNGKTIYLQGTYSAENETAFDTAWQTVLTSLR